VGFSVQQTKLWIPSHSVEELPLPELRLCWHEFSFMFYAQTMERW